MSKTYKDRKGKKEKAMMLNNGPASFKKDERQKRRAQAKDCLNKGRELDKTYVYSEYYW